jgi:beta-xylosidase
MHDSASYNIQVKCEIYNIKFGQKSEVKKINTYTFHYHHIHNINIAYVISKQITTGNGSKVGLIRPPDSTFYL